MDLDIFLGISAVTQFLCLLATLAIMFVPQVVGEDKLWRSLGTNSLRRFLTKRLKTPQRFSDGQTESIAVRNLRWHLVLTFALWVQTLLGTRSPSLAVQLLGIFYMLPAIGWLLGSIVQRQKIAVLRRLHGRHARPPIA